MVTRLKPQRVKTSNTPTTGQSLGYYDSNNFRWQTGGGGGGDMAYSDFERQTLTGNSLTIEDISNSVTPSSDFTVVAGTVKPGIEYVLRVNTGNTAYTMTLGTGVTNPNSYNTTLKANTVNQFNFIATNSSQLELEGVNSAAISEINWGDIGGTLSNQTDLNTALGNKADKISGGTTDNLASLTSGGGIADSGIAKTNVEITTNKETGDTPTDSTTKYPSSHTVKKYVDDQVSAATAGAVSDVAYASSWDGVTGIAPSKNAVYDKISAMDTTIGNKANDSDVVKLTGDQTISGTKTFNTSPVVPSKTSDATNTGTAIATEAQVYKKQDTLTSQTAYTSKGSATKVPQITTNNLGQVTAISEVDISVGDKIEYKTQAEYTALLPGAESDGKHYFIYSTSS